MYIRRKVFSLLQDENGEERYFSTTDITLEDAEQRIFSLNEHDEEEQREYAEKEGLSTGAKVGLGTTAGLAATAAAVYGAKKGGKALVKAAEKLAEKSVKNGTASKNYNRINLMKSIGDKLQKPGDYIVKVTEGGKTKVREVANSIKTKTKSKK